MQFRSVDRSRTRSEIKDVSRGVACEETIPWIRDANTSPMLIAGRKPVYRGPRLENATGNIHAKGEIESRELKNAANPFGPERCNYEFPHLVKEQNASRAEDNGRKIH